MDNKGHVRLTPHQICAVGCETPTINYNRYSGKKYRYFYAITSDVDDMLSAGQIYKAQRIILPLFCSFKMRQIDSFYFNTFVVI